MSDYILDVAISERADLYLLRDIGADREVKTIDEVFRVIMKRLVELS